MPPLRARPGEQRSGDSDKIDPNKIEPNKVDQDAASYTELGPPPFVCGNCEYYQPGSVGEDAVGEDSGTGACTKVQGDISERATCRFWTNRESVSGTNQPDESEAAPDDEAEVGATNEDDARKDDARKDYE